LNIFVRKKEIGSMATSKKHIALYLDKEKLIVLKGLWVMDRSKGVCRGKSFGRFIDRILEEYMIRRKGDVKVITEAYREVMEDESKTMDV
jgi:hypothetical protein